MTDDGEPIGLPLHELEQSISSLKNIAINANATIHELTRVKSKLTNLTQSQINLLKGMHSNKTNT